MVQPIAFPPSTMPATSPAQAVAWLQEMTTIFFTFCGFVGVVGPRHVFGQPAFAKTFAFARAITLGGVVAVRDAPA